MPFGGTGLPTQVGKKKNVFAAPSAATQIESTILNPKNQGEGRSWKLQTPGGKHVIDEVNTHSGRGYLFPRICKRNPSDGVSFTLPGKLQPNTG